MKTVSARWLLPALGGLGVLWPGAPGQILGGLPLSAAGILAALGVVYAALALPAPGWRTGRWLALGFALVVGLKLLGAASSPPLGLTATYWAAATSTGSPERSTDFGWLHDATRIDPSLDLRGEDFAVHFFNDAARFNFGPDVQPGRDQLPFSVRWQGFLRLRSGSPADGAHHFRVESTGPAQLTIDGADVSDADQGVDLSAGLHPIEIDYVRPEAQVPMLRVTWDPAPGGPMVVLGGDDLRWQASDTDVGLSSVVGRLADVGLAGLILAWVGLGLWKARTDGGLARAGLGAIPLGFAVDGMLLQAPLAGRATILSGLDDWLIYESSARDILLNGPLMDGGQGHAAPFYGQPLYPYVLALAHRLTGESLFGPLVLQFAALGLVLALTAVLSRRAFGRWVDGLAALALLWLLLQLEAEHFKVARQLFNENLYMPLVMVSLIVLVGLAGRGQPPSWWRAGLVGGLLGLTAISRSQFLLFVPFGALVMLRAWRSRRGAALVSVLAMVLGVLVVIAPVTARNWVVSGQLVPISSSGGASLLEFHRPPAGLIDSAALDTNPLFNALHLDTQTRTVLAFVRADPGGYLATLLPLGAHSIGLQGRNDPGIYWPLFITFLLYLASFALRDTRRLRVWPIHAFVATHLLVLMLFEADTYGYRLVMPMYAPMVAVAAQVPLAVGRALGRWRAGLRDRPADARRAERYARAGWGLVAAAALAWQAGSLVSSWPDRDGLLHGLGGPAAHAAATADQVGASAIYYASIDGTPRHFGAGTLPGLRYPWIKWFDPSRSVPLPPPGSRAVYALAELNGHSVAGDLVSCLGQPNASSEIVVDAAQARQGCVGQWSPATVLGDGVRFEGVADVEQLRVPDSAQAGQPLDAQLLWDPLVAHPAPQQFSLQLDDPQASDGTLWGNGTLQLYPTPEWAPGEAVLSRLPVATDPTAIPQAYRLTLGIGSPQPNSPAATAVWQGSRVARVPVATVTLSPGSSPEGQPLPAGMQPVEGPPLMGGGLELIGARPLPTDAAIGGPLPVGLLWRATQDAPQAAQLKLRLVRQNGDVVQESVLPLLGGRVLPSALQADNVVRDEQTLTVDSRAPAEAVSVDVDLLDASGASVAERPVRLGSVELTGRAHVFDTSPPGPPEASFGDGIQLVSDQLEPAQARAGAKVTLKLRWRSVAEMNQAYKVFVHLLDPSGQQVIAQHDAEPQDGQAPTTSWVVGELIDDQYELVLPAALPAGDYPIELGVYDARSGDRLTMPDGANHFVLSVPLHVTP